MALVPQSLGGIYFGRTRRPWQSAGLADGQHQRSVAGDKAPGRGVGRPQVARTQLAPGPRAGLTTKLPRSGPTDSSSANSDINDRNTQGSLGQSSAAGVGPGGPSQAAGAHGEKAPRGAARVPVGRADGEGGGTEIDAEEERVLSEIETGVLDVFGDSYCNKHLMYGIVELVLVRLMPELAEKGVIELWEERLD